MSIYLILAFACIFVAIGLSGYGLYTVLSKEGCGKCPAETHCKDGKCVSLPPIPCNPPCQGNNVCVNGQCVCQPNWPCQEGGQFRCGNNGCETCACPPNTMCSGSPTAPNPSACRAL